VKKHNHYTRAALARLLRVALVFAFFLIPSCTLFHGVSYYDPTTYRNLTDLKPHVMFLYVSFGEQDVDFDAVRYIRLRLAQMHEYEKGKGPLNAETARQIGNIIVMFEDDVQARLSAGMWSETQINNSTENIVDAFDIAIQTERLKNKNE